MRNLGILFLLVCLTSAHEASAQLPKSDLYKLVIDDKQQPEEISFMNHFNKGSYNNQPSFISQEEVLLTCELSKETTDIIKLNLDNNSVKRLTSTVENEYSPKLIDDESFLVVREEQDSKTQSLWSYPLDLSHTGSRLFSELNNIGYFQPLPNSKIALFTLEEGNFPLYIGNLRNQTTKKISANIGRCFQTNKKGELIFLEKQNDGKSRIKSYNTINQQISDLAEAINDSEDFCLFGPQEDILMAVGPEIFRFDNMSRTWILWQDLAKFGILNISRLACSDNTLLIVNSYK